MFVNILFTLNQTILNVDKYMRKLSMLFSSINRFKFDKLFVVIENKYNRAFYFISKRSKQDVQIPIFVLLLYDVVLQI